MVNGRHPARVFLGQKDRLRPATGLAVEEAIDLLPVFRLGSVGHRATRRRCGFPTIPAWYICRFLRIPSRHF